MGKAEIMAELAHLSAEELADVEAWIDRMADDRSVAATSKPVMPTSHLRSPRLADPAKAGDFRKQAITLE